MRAIKVELPRELASVELHVLSDLHIGAPTCDMKGIQAQADYIQHTENAYCILTGDIIDNATRASVGDVYEGLSPLEQMKTAAAIFNPIKDKILGVTSGNHCDRSYKTDGVDPMYFLCAELGIQEKYDQYGILLFIRFGRMHRGTRESKDKKTVRKMCYTVYATHGSGGGSTPGGKANRLRRLGELVNADVVIISHTHFPLCFKECTFEIDYPNSAVRTRETTYVNSGARLGWGGYSERMSLKPSSGAQPRIVLDGRVHRIDVTV